MIDKFPDEYEVRIAPGLIVALPALIEVIYMLPLLSNVPSLPQTTFLPARPGSRRQKAKRNDHQNQH